MLLHPNHVHVPMPAEPFHDIVESSSSTTDSTSKRKRRHVIKKSERAATLTKAARSASLLHSDVLPKLQSGGVVFDAILETPNTWTGVVRIPGSESVDRESNTSPVKPSAFDILPGQYRRVVFQCVCCFLCFNHPLMYCLFSAWFLNYRGQRHC